MTAEKIGQHETQDWRVTLYSDGVINYEHRRTGFREVRDVDQLRRKLREKWGANGGPGRERRE